MNDHHMGLPIFTESNKVIQNHIVLQEPETPIQASDSGQFDTVPDIGNHLFFHSFIRVMIMIRFVSKKVLL